MKKLLGLIIVLIIGWLGTTFYIGNNVESKAKDLISKSKQKYKSMGMDLNVEIKEKSFFSSKAEFTFNYTSPEMKELLANFYKLPIKMDYDIEHGPFFFKKGLGFGALRVKSEKPIATFLSDDLIKNSGITEKDLILKTNSVVSFTHNMVTDFSVSAFKYNIADADIGIDSAEFNGHSEINLDTYASTGSFTLPFIKVFNPDNPKVDFYHAKDVKFDFNIDKFIADSLYIGDISLHSKEMTISSDEFKEEITFGANIDIKIDEDKDKNLKLAYLFDAEHIKGEIPEEFIPFKIDPKKASAGVIVEGLLPEGLLAFQKYSQEVSAKSQSLMEKVMKAEDEDRDKVFEEFKAFQKEMPLKMLELGQGLFASKKGKISYNVKFENKQNKVSNADFKLAYIGDKFTGSMEEVILSFKEKALDIFTLDVDVNLDETLVSAIQAEMNSREKEQMNMGIQTGVSQGIVIQKDGAYKVKVDYKPGKLLLNGEDKSEMINMLKMLSQK